MRNRPISITSLDQLAAEIRAVNRANGFEPVGEDTFAVKPNDVAAKLALTTSEVSEALEAVRTGDVANFEEEMVDVIIRALDILGGFSCSIDELLTRKLDANRERGFRHGGKRI